MTRNLSPTHMLHFEMWVGLRKNRQQLRRTLKRVYNIARPITQHGGGSGPWLFIVNRDSANPKTIRLRKMLGVNSKEDVWLELAFYPNKAEMKKIIRRIWSQPKFESVASGLDQLISKRKRGYEATLAYASLQSV